MEENTSIARLAKVRHTISRNCFRPTQPPTQHTTAPFSFLAVAYRVYRSEGIL